MEMKPLKAGLIGAGIISETYLDNLCRRFRSVEVVGCSDLVPERSALRAEQYGIRQMTNEEIFADPEIELVINTTYASSHTLVNRQAIEAGKNVYTEKTLGANFAEARQTSYLAQQRGVRIGCAPDTFLGGGYQTCRKLLDDGYLGCPVAATAFLARAVWPDRAEGEARFEEGSTLPYDMSCYYTHALIHLLGPIANVCGYAGHYPHVYTNPFHPHCGEATGTGAPTDLFGVLKFCGGAYATLVVLGESFTETPRLEIFGTEGTLICPDPNTFGGPVRLMRKGNDRFYDIPLTHGNITSEKGAGNPGKWGDSRRGIGVAEMAWAIRSGRPHRCSDSIHLHALEVIHGLEESGNQGIFYRMTTRPGQPAPLLPGYFDRSHEGAIAE